MLSRIKRHCVVLIADMMGSLFDAVAVVLDMCGAAVFAYIENTAVVQVDRSELLSGGHRTEWSCTKA